MTGRNLLDAYIVFPLCHRIPEKQRASARHWVAIAFRRSRDTNPVTLEIDDRDDGAVAGGAPGGNVGEIGGGGRWRQ